jgi:hypothetical protein
MGIATRHPGQTESSCTVHSHLVEHGIDVTACIDVYR